MIMKFFSSTQLEFCILNTVCHNYTKDCKI